MVYLMIGFAEFHANAADQTGSICAFKRHQNEKIGAILIRIQPLSNDTKIMKTASIDEIPPPKKNKRPREGIYESG